MKLFINQKMISFVDTYLIYNDNKQLKYIAKSNFGLYRTVELFKDEFSVAKLITKDPNNYQLLINDQLFDTIIREKKFGYHYYFEKKGWKMKGDFLGFEFELFDENNHLIMSFYKESMTMNDKYIIDNYDERYEKICILIVLMIDIYFGFVKGNMI